MFFGDPFKGPGESTGYRIHLTPVCVVKHPKKFQGTSKYLNPTSGDFRAARRLLSWNIGFYNYYSGYKSRRNNWLRHTTIGEISINIHFSF